MEEAKVFNYILLQYPHTHATTHTHTHMHAHTCTHTQATLVGEKQPSKQFILPEEVQYSNTVH